jgi:hypothetical protein
MTFLVPAPIVDAEGTPVAWNALWAGPHEALSLAMKYAWANALDAKGACKSLFGKSLGASQSPRIHGRSLLIPRWISENTPGLTGIGSLVLAGCLERYTGRWTHMISTDANFRYCPLCIDQGYQSALCQIDALRRCPVHGISLLDQCRRCGAKTCRYAISADSLGAPFCCWSCGVPLGDRFDPRTWKSVDIKSRSRAAFLPLALFLQQVSQSQLAWHQWDEWFGPWLGEQESHEKRIATFTILRQVIPSDLDEELFQLPARPLIALSGTINSTYFYIRKLHFVSNDESRYQIYKSLRRYLRKRLPRHARGWAVYDIPADRINLSDESFDLSLTQCPFSQAFMLWRLRFEEIGSLVQKRPLDFCRLSLRQEARNWPWYGTADDTAWANNALVCFHAAAEIVSDWCEKAAALAGENGLDGEQINPELRVEFAHLLSPRRLPIPPTVTALLASEAPPPSTAYYVVGPANGYERLDRCCRCASQARGSF